MLVTCSHRLKEKRQIRKLMAGTYAHKDYMPLLEIDINTLLKIKAHAPFEDGSMDRIIINFRI
jgi:hypothetical protein